ncbi:uncharacterized protein LOC130647459 [Hydractinia symbiolongicarpus]|uniref:uncharacterized protein LOC130647459 n=1 Tax=Hydractinia symbiolongicarpus TaxID=13093 RepID=UPI00254B70BB|nr:uncharacterized protein LOC130647459 [Hydractinia symbiolongicarpus]
MHYYIMNGLNHHYAILPVQKKELLGSFRASALDKIGLNMLYHCKGQEDGSVWSSWTPWGKCRKWRVEDPQPLMKRHRMCTAENINACITSTNESSTFEFQSKPCDVGSSYKVAYWSRWSEWTACVANGIGNQQRSRTCKGDREMAHTCVGPPNEDRFCLRTTIGNAPLLQFTVVNLNYRYRFVLQDPRKIYYYYNELIANGYSFLPVEGTSPWYDFTLDDVYGCISLAMAKHGRPGDVAVLKSDMVAGTGAAGGCFILWFHMYGIHQGSFSIHIRSQEKEEELFIRHGDQGKYWVPVALTINSPAQFELEIKATRGNGPLGDIAVDGIYYFSAKCVGNTSPRQSI